MKNRSRFFAIAFAVTTTTTGLLQRANAGYVSIVAAGFASTATNTEPTTGALQANRNGQVFTSFESNGFTINSMLEAGAGIASGTYTFSLPNYQSITGFEVSNYGVAADVFSPAEPDYVAVAPTATPLVNISSGTAYAEDQSLPSINDGGVIAWVSRQSLQSGRNQLYVWSPGHGTTRLVDASSGSSLSYGSPVVDSAGVLSLVYRGDASAPNTDFVGHLAGATSGGTVWTKNTLNPDYYGVDLGPVNLKGQSLYTAYNTIAISDETSTHTVLFAGNSFNQPRPGYSELADNGNTLVVLQGTSTSNPADGVATGILVRSDGSQVNLKTLLPAGQTQAPDPLYQMNFRGDILLEGVDASTGYFDYSVYQNGLLTPLISLPTQAISPILTNGDQFYFLASQNGAYSLEVATVPEPASLGLLATTAVFLIRTKKRGVSQRGTAA